MNGWATNENDIIRVTSPVLMGGDGICRGT